MEYHEYFGFLAKRCPYENDESKAGLFQARMSATKRLFKAAKNSNTEAELIAIKEETPLFL